MRLSQEQIQTIKTAILEALPDARILLYGSRCDDHKRGGDIDLLIYTNEFVDVFTRANILANICKQLGERKIDMKFAKDTEKTDFILSIEAESIEL